MPNRRSVSVWSTVQFLPPCLSVPETGAAGLSRCCRSAPGGARSGPLPGLEELALVPQGPCQSYIRVHLLWGQVGRFGKSTNRVAELPLRQELPPQPDQGLHQGRQEVLGAGREPQRLVQEAHRLAETPSLERGGGASQKGIEQELGHLVLAGFRREAKRCPQDRNGAAPLTQIQISTAQIEIGLAKIGVELRGFLQQRDRLGILPTLKQTKTVLKGHLGIRAYPDGGTGGQPA